MKKMRDEHEVSRSTRPVDCPQVVDQGGEVFVRRHNPDLFDEHARDIMLRRIEGADATEYLKERARCLSGAIGYYKLFAASLDEFGAWCVRDGGNEAQINDGVLSDLPREQKRVLRRLLSLDAILADRSVYIDLWLPTEPGVMSLRHWPVAHRERFADRLYARGGYFVDLLPDGRERPVLRAVRGVR